MISRQFDWALLFARVPFGIYFWLAGYNKIAGVGVGNFVSSNVDNAAQFMGPLLGKAYLTALPFVELLVGLALIAGVFTRTAAVIAMLMLVSFIMATGGLKLNMAKIADAGGGEPFSKNVIFATLAIAIALLGPGRFAFSLQRSKSKATPIA
jgi:uncharacterized membrane protein YphA (DoxX/SURF4 family)